MSLQFYNYLHLLGVILLVLGYGSLLTRAVLAPENRPFRVFGAVLGGSARALLIVSPFALHANRQWGWPLWAHLKNCNWVDLGMVLAAINRKRSWNTALWIAVFLLVAASAWLGTFGRNFAALH